MQIGTFSDKHKYDIILPFQLLNLILMEGWVKKTKSRYSIFWLLEVQIEAKLIISKNLY